MSRSHFYCLNATIPLTCTLANEYPASNEISKSTVRVDCIACDALLQILHFFKKNKAFCPTIGA